MCILRNTQEYINKQICYIFHFSKEKRKAGVISKHKVSLKQLKDQDPEFFEFLKDEDESLLKFGNLNMNVLKFC